MEKNKEHSHSVHKKHLRNETDETHHDHEENAGSSGSNHHNHKNRPDEKHAAEKHTHSDGYGGYEGHGGHHAHMAEDFKKRFWISLVLTVPILAISPMIQGFLNIEGFLSFSGDIYVIFLLSTAVFVYGGYPFFKGIYDELQKKQPGMMTLIAVAISTAYIYSAAIVFGLSGRMFFWELATLIDIMLLGHWIEMKSVMGASRALHELAQLLPSDAHKIEDNGETVDVPIEELSNSDKVMVKPGENIPVDGHVVDGRSAVNEAMISGESKPVEKTAGDEVIGGSINGEGSLTVEVSKTGDESYLSQVIELVKQAQQSKSKTQDIVNRAAMWLTVISLTSGAATLLVWLLLYGKEFAFSLERAVTVMVITCPHALGLAAPLVVAVSTALSARKGLLIRNRAAFERARNIQAIIFDKTGTLTKGEFGVSDVLVFDDSYDENEILEYAASVEANSEHPIARGIVDSSENKYFVEDFDSIPGKGAMGHVNGKDVKTVSPGYAHENNIDVNDERIEKLSKQGKTVVYVLFDDKPAGAIALADIIRPESKEAIKRLKKSGIQCMMLTGDNKKVAQWVAGELDLDDYFAEVLPEEKTEKVKEVQARGLITAMTGDGVNDAPALAQADVGIAIGAGTDVAVETADIVLVKSNPLDAVTIIGLARSTYRKLIQNLIWATGYNIVAIPLAAGVLYHWGIILSPAVGAVLMSISTVIVAVNAKLLKI